VSPHRRHHVSFRLPLIMSLTLFAKSPLCYLRADCSQGTELSISSREFYRLRSSQIVKASSVRLKPEQSFTVSAINRMLSVVTSSPQKRILLPLAISLSLLSGPFINENGVHVSAGNESFGAASPAATTAHAPRKGARLPWPSWIPNSRRGFSGPKAQINIP